MEEGFRIEIAGPEQSMPEPVPIGPPMPDFSGRMRPLKFLSWIPFLLTAVVVFILVFFIQLAYNILTQPEAPITYGAVMMLFLVSLAAALIMGFIAKLNAEGKFRRKPRSDSIPIH